MGIFSFRGITTQQQVTVRHRHLAMKRAAQSITLIAVVWVILRHTTDLWKDTSALCPATGHLKISRRSVRFDAVQSDSNVISIFMTEEHLL
jgi:hypothetical protein